MSETNTQPKNFAFGDDEKMLRDSARKFFAATSTADAVHKLVADNPDPYREIAVPWDQSLWQQIVELGWAGVAVPERAGGMGMPAVAVAALAEESGKAAYVGPLLPTLCATFVLNCCKTSQANQYLARIIEGSAVTLAIANSNGEWCYQDSPVSVKDGKLNGTSPYVQDLQKCDYFLVSAKNTKGELDLYMVPKASEGVSLVADAIVDLTRDQGRLVLNQVPVEEAHKVNGGSGSDILKAAAPMLITLVAADIAGAAEWQLQTTTEYAKTREQFGRPIGFFQAVKHPLVDMMVMIDQTRGHVYNAACAWDFEPENVAQYAHMAKASAGDTAIFCSSRSVQLHGGIGFTWECYLHLYFKRQMHNQMLFGDAKHHRAKLADLLLGEPVS